MAQASLKMEKFKAMLKEFKLMANYTVSHTKMELQKIMFLHVGLLIHGKNAVGKVFRE